MQGDVDAGWHMVRDERRQADAKVDVLSIAQLARDTRDDPPAEISRGSSVSTAKIRSHQADRPFLDAFLVARALEDVPYEDSRRHDLLGIDLSRLDQVLH